MMNNLKNEELISRTQFLAGEERRITLELIECLEEISRRMIYAELGYGSLFEFCTKYLLLSEGSAHRRISAMRLARDVPEVKERLHSGALSLSNAAKIEVSLKKKSPLQKRAVVSECLNLSQKECELKLFTLVPELKESIQFTEKFRTINETHSELKLIITVTLKAKIDELQNLLSHVDQQKSLIKLIERLVDAELAKQKGKRVALPIAKGYALPIAKGYALPIAKGYALPIAKNRARAAGQSDAHATDQKAAINGHSVIQKANTTKDSRHAQIKYKPSNPAAEQVPFKRTAVSAALRRVVWTRANHQCQYVGCKSRFQLQIEHIKPVALGGGNELKNLQLLCRTHNLLRARQVFGRKHMEKFSYDS